MTTNRYTRRSINLDDASHNRCKALADEMAISISGLLRILIKQAYKQHERNRAAAAGTAV
jgi:antitoxin component of RelBE/YafQ-DinJ toxin-antitoxin module